MIPQGDGNYTPLEIKVGKKNKLDAEHLLDYATARKIRLGFSKVGRILSWKGGAHCIVYDFGRKNENIPTIFYLCCFFGYMVFG